MCSLHWEMPTVTELAIFDHGPLCWLQPFFCIECAVETYIPRHCSISSVVIETSRVSINWIKQTTIYAACGGRKSRNTWFLSQSVTLTGRPDWNCMWSVLRNCDCTKWSRCSNIYSCNVVIYWGFPAWVNSGPILVAKCNIYTCNVYMLYCEAQPLLANWWLRLEGARRVNIGRAWPELGAMVIGMLIQSVCVIGFN